MQNEIEITIYFIQSTRVLIGNWFMLWNFDFYNPINISEMNQ